MNAIELLLLQYVVWQNPWSTVLMMGCSKDKPPLNKVTCACVHFLYPASYICSGGELFTRMSITDIE